jgi:hypothetical protein
MALRWAAGRWRVQQTPSRPGGLGSFLTGVSCSSAAACTAVGDHAISDLGQQPIAERWDGRRWIADPVPSPQGGAESYLSGVSCTSADACVAVGGHLVGLHDHGLIERWNGRRWSIEAVLRMTSGLADVSCVTPRACMAVGDATDASGSGQPLAGKWNGRRWTPLAVPVPPSGARGSLFSVSCTTADRCTAAGSDENGRGLPSTLAERWQGSAWTIQPVPVPQGWHGSDRAAVSCANARACALAGDQTNDIGLPDGPLAAQWSGTRWQLQPVPRPSGGKTAGLTGVSCTTVVRCVAVGTYVYGRNLTALAVRRG